MASPLLRTLAVVVAFLSVFGNCWLRPEDTLFNSLLPPRGWRFGNRASLARRASDCDPDIDEDAPDCRPLCGGSGSPCAGGAVNGLNKRIAKLSLGDALNSTDALSETFHQLSKRDFTPVAQQNLGNYVQGQFSDTTFDPRYGQPTPLIADTVPQLNIVAERALGNAPFAIGTPGLCGCTVVTVVSDQSVYMGHFFEDPSWTTKTKSRFQNEVLNFFINGGADPVGTGAPITAARYPVASTRVYIMTPRDERFRTDATKSEYGKSSRSKLPQLTQQIEDTIGNVPILIYNYDPISCEDDNIFANEKGCALFQYDPTGFNNAPGWRIFYEHHSFQSTTPLPGGTNFVPDQ
ncbi:hypothetical protein F5884DRAFT_815018 [Xylogone sp. PMI_703]|nr:hypothetical protein F5884DRAFT_815018 [Xylogone sp. PMI_703]